MTVEGGTWDADSLTFTAASLSEANALRVTVEQPETSLYFGVFAGRSTAGVSASAIAMKPGGGVGARFLIDDEMIDTDVAAIQSLASWTGKSTDYLLTARGFNRGKRYGQSDWTWEDNFLELGGAA